MASELNPADGGVYTRDGKEPHLFIGGNVKPVGVRNGGEAQAFRVSCRCNFSASSPPL